MGVITAPDSSLAPVSSRRWTAAAVGAGVAGVCAAVAATTALIISVRIGEAGETVAVLGSVVLGLALVLALASVVVAVVALARREGPLALSALVFSALTLVVLYLAPAIGLWAAGP